MECDDCNINSNGILLNSFPLKLILSFTEVKFNTRLLPFLLVPFPPHRPTSPAISPTFSDLSDHHPYKVCSLNYVQCKRKSFFSFIKFSLSSSSIHWILRQSLTSTLALWNSLSSGHHERGIRKIRASILRTFCQSFQKVHLRHCPRRRYQLSPSNSSCLRFCLTICVEYYDFLSNSSEQKKQKLSEIKGGIDEAESLVLVQVIGTDWIGILN